MQSITQLLVSGPSSLAAGLSGQMQVTITAVMGNVSTTYDVTIN